MKKLKTVVIATDSARLNGGISKVTIMEALGLCDMGYRVVYFAPNGPIDPALAVSGVEVICLEEPDVLDDHNRLRAMHRGIWNGRAIEALKSVLEDLDPSTTVLHAHSFSRALSPALGPVLTNGPVPAFFTMHEYFLACPNGGFYDYQAAEICTRKAMGLSCLTTNCDARSGVHKAWRILRQAALLGPGGLPRKLRDIGYISETQLATLRPYLPQDARLHHILNPIDFDPDLPRVQVEDNDVFLFIGRLMPEKGAAAFAAAAKAAGVRAVFLGAGPEERRIRILNPDAELMGWVTPQEVSEWLSKAKAMVFPSVWPEPFGLVAAEALSRGVPALAGRWNAASEMISHRETGLIYETPDALAEALQQMSDLPRDRLKAMSQTAYARRAGYVATREDHCQRVVDILEGLLQ